VPLTALKTTSFEVDNFRGKNFFWPKEKNEGSSAVAGTAHCWPHIFF